MTIQLTANASEHDALLEVDNPTDASLDDVLKIDSELVVVRGRPSVGGKLLVGRGFLGSARVSHSVGATLTTFSLEDVGVVGGTVTTPLILQPADLEFGEHALLIDVTGVADGTGLRIEADNGNGPAVYVQNSQTFAEVFSIDAAGALTQAAALYLFPGLGGDLVPLTVNRTGGASALVVVKASGVEVFRIAADGSVHIKTGTAIVADL